MPAEIYALITRIMRMVGHEKAADLRVIFTSSTHAVRNIRIMITENPDEVLHPVDDLVEQFAIRICQTLIGLNIVKAVSEGDDTFGRIILHQARQAVQAIARVVGRQRHMAVHLQEAGFLEMQICHAERVMIQEHQAFARITGRHARPRAFNDGCLFQTGSQRNPSPFPTGLRRS